jgi:hypothetical protein
MRHRDFHALLCHASLSHSNPSPGPLSKADREKPVRVQWDPERDAALHVLPYRSIQVGIGREVVRRWVDEWIVRIEDVTERAVGLKAFLEGKEGSVDLGELVERGLVPTERVYNVPEDLRGVLGMDGVGDGEGKAGEI